VPATAATLDPGTALVDGNREMRRLFQRFIR